MLLLADRVKTAEEGKALLREQIKNGKALEKFRELLLQQGGDVRILEDASLLPLSAVHFSVKAEAGGYLNHMDTALIGRASQETGAGRAYKDQPLDFGAGIIMKKRLGDKVEAGEELAVIYSETEEKCRSAAGFLKQALTFGTTPAELPPLILNIISERKG